MGANQSSVKFLTSSMRQGARQTLVTVSKSNNSTFTSGAANKAALNAQRLNPAIGTSVTRTMSPEADALAFTNRGKWSYCI